MRRSFFQALILFVLLALPTALLVLKWRGGAEEGASTGKSSPPVSAETSTEFGEPQTGADPVEPLEATEGGQPTAAQSANQVPAYFDVWESGFRDPGRGGMVQALDRWRESVRALPTEEAVRRLTTYWRSGRDLRLGLPFAPGEEGEMHTAPTLRTAVLDLLGRLDPAAAFALAEEAFEGPKESADEYALHLRNFAWGAPDSLENEAVRSFLVEQTLEMLNYPAWRTQPSEGFQEAFDVLVWSRATETLPVLLPMMERSADSVLRHPAAIVVERLAIDRPVEVLRSIVESPEQWRSVGSLAAGLVARANLSVPTERALAESYFLADEREGAERDRFLAMLPNLNLTMSYNLLSDPPRGYGYTEVVERLRGAEATLTDWADDPRFRSWEPEIQETLVRIRDHLADVP